MMIGVFLMVIIFGLMMRFVGNVDCVRMVF